MSQHGLQIAAQQLGGWLFLLIADTVFSDSADLMTIFLPTLLQLSNLADSLKRFFMDTILCCTDTHTPVQVSTHTHIGTHAQVHTRAMTCMFVLQQCSSDKGDFLPYNFKAFLVLTEYPKILLLQTVLVCEKVFPDIFFQLRSPNIQ